MPRWSSSARRAASCWPRRRLPTPTRCALLSTLIETPHAPLESVGSLDVALGRFFAECALGLMRRSGLDRGDIVAIGHSGHTVFHKPAAPDPFSMQLGDANVVVACTGIATIADAVTTVAPDTTRAVLCGGGAHHKALVARLSGLLPALSVDSSATLGIEPEWVEAFAFTWRARARLRQEPGNVPTVTGARQEAVLGALYSSGGVG